MEGNIGFVEYLREKWWISFDVWGTSWSIGVWTAWFGISHVVLHVCRQCTQGGSFLDSGIEAGLSASQPIISTYHFKTPRRPTLYTSLLNPISHLKKQHIISPFFPFSPSPPIGQRLTWPTHRHQSTPKICRKSRHFHPSQSCQWFWHRLFHVFRRVCVVVSVSGEIGFGAEIFERCSHSWDYIDGSFVSCR